MTHPCPMSTANFETFLNKAPYAFFRWENAPGWPVIYVSDTVLPLFGHHPNEFMSGDISYSSLIHPDDIERVGQEVETASVEGKVSFIHEPYRLRAKNNDWVWIKDYTQIIRNSDGDIIEYYGFLEDFTDEFTYRRLANEAQFINQQISNALDQSNLISRADAYGNITYVNNHLIELTGYSCEELIGKPHSILRHPDTDNAVFQDMWQTIKQYRPWTGTLKNRKKNGDAYYVEMTIMPMLDEEGQFIEYLAIRHEVTALMTKQQELQKAITTSKLLNIPNRLALLNHLDNTKCYQLAMLDIDDFRQLNEYFGHKFGDDLLINTMLHIFLHKPDDYDIYHFNADQFVIVGHEQDNNLFKADMAALQSALNTQKMTMQSQDLSVNITLAISFEHGINHLNSLEMAMDYAKKHHQNLVIYNRAIDTYEQRAQNLMWSEKLNDALADNRITTFYQPILNLRTGLIEKHESLVRMIDKDGEVIAPYFFLPVSKKTKKYNMLSKRVVEKSFATFKDNGHAFSINISATDMTNADFMRTILAQLENCIAPERVTFEILESEEITNYKKVEHFIRTMRGFGCKIAIDDFGAGYANYENLLKLNADFIKIDGSLIKDIANNQDAYDIVESIVRFAKKKNIQTIAEFVSDEAILNTIRKLDIDFAQGFYIGHPQDNLHHPKAFQAQPR